MRMTNKTMANAAAKEEKNHGKATECVVNVVWDDEAYVWIATSADVPGLVLESGSYDVLLERVKQALPELFVLNAQQEPPEIVRFISEHRERLDGKSFAGASKI